MHQQGYTIGPWSMKLQYDSQAKALYSVHNAAGAFFYVQTYRRQGCPSWTTLIDIISQQSWRLLCR